MTRKWLIATGLLAAAVIAVVPKFTEHKPEVRAAAVKVEREKPAASAPILPETGFPIRNICVRRICR